MRGKDPIKHILACAEFVGGGNRTELGEVALEDVLALEGGVLASHAGFKEEEFQGCGWTWMRHEKVTSISFLRRLFDGGNHN